MNSKRMLISISAALVIAGLHAVPSHALPPEGTFNYVVDHPTLGDVGLNENTVTHDGNRVIIVSKGNLLAKVGPLVLRQEDFDRREVHEDGRLIEYSSSTITNAGKRSEERFEITSRFENGKLTIITEDGEYEAPENVFTTNPMFIEAMSVANLIGAKTGILHDVKITGGEIEDVSVGDRTMAAKHYVVTGTSSLTDLWYDGDLLVKFIVKDGTTPVSVWLQQPSADTQ